VWVCITVARIALYGACSAGELCLSDNAACLRGQTTLRVASVSIDRTCVCIYNSGAYSVEWSVFGWRIVFVGQRCVSTWTDHATCGICINKPHVRGCVCITVARIALNGACSAGELCLSDNAACLRGRCQCRPGFFSIATDCGIAYHTHL